MKTLTRDQVQTLQAFFDAFEQTTTGAWAPIEAHMKKNWGIEDPEAELDAVQELLQG